MPSDDQVKLLVTYRMLVKPENCRLLTVSQGRIQYDGSIKLTDEEFQKELASLEHDMCRIGWARPILFGMVPVVLAVALSFFLSPQYLYIAVLFIPILLLGTRSRTKQHDMIWRDIMRQMNERA